MSDNILTLKFPHRSFSPPPKKASLVVPRSTPCDVNEVCDMRSGQYVIYSLKNIMYTLINGIGLLCGFIKFNWGAAMYDQNELQMQTRRLSDILSYILHILIH